ncbi:hypothetical protein CYY_000736 [Polysphondylium violaceum]|uniref:Rho-GAP domain-containing protein n=1 Tax=Polysphondylium violaceum TaxID=133409 RepID=A0A8J4Q3A1_9MYCE|nr:hypothetical protein CYY_000736 [Polysphondylium violaceum]
MENSALVMDGSKINTLHKNDIKSNHLIDEISDLREVLRKSVIGPNININDYIDGADFSQLEDDDEDWLIKQHLKIKKEKDLTNSKSNSSLSNIINSYNSRQNGSEKNLDVDKDIESLMNSLNSLENNQVNISNHYNNSNNNGNNSNNGNNTVDKGKKKKKILMLKNPKQQPTTTTTTTTSSPSSSSYNYSPISSPVQQHHNQQHQSTLSPQTPKIFHQKKRFEQEQSSPHQYPASVAKNSSPIVLNGINNQQHHHQQQHQQQQSFNLKKEQLNSLAQNLNLNISQYHNEEELNQKISEVLLTAKYRIERIQFKNRVLLTSHLHNLSSEIHQLLEKRITKKQVNIELKQNAKIVGDCDLVSSTILNFLQDLLSQKLSIDESIDAFSKKKKLRSKESKQIEDFEKKKRKVESAIAFLNIEKRSVRELRDRFVSVCNEVTRLYEAINVVERDLSKWDIELERIYSQIREGYYSDYFKIHPLFQSCSQRIKDHYHIKQDLVRELARREAARIASEIYISGIIQILDCGHDLITDERMVDVARVRGLEHQVHMLYHALHDQQAEKFSLLHSMYLQDINQKSNDIGVPSSASSSASSSTFVPSPNNHNMKSSSVLDNTSNSIGNNTPTATSNQNTPVTKSNINISGNNILKNSQDTIMKQQQQQQQQITKDHINQKSSVVMESLIKNYESLFPNLNMRGPSKSALILKTSSYLDNIADLSADVLIKSAEIAKDKESKIYSESLKVNGNTMQPEHVDVYMTSELLKHFFKTIEPIFVTDSFINTWVSIAKCENEHERVVGIENMLRTLNDEKKAILGSLIKLLNRVASRSSPSNQYIPLLAQAFTCLILGIK